MLRRVKDLLERLGPPIRDYPSERLRSTRAIKVLERIGSRNARVILNALSEGSPYALQTREAKAALERLEGRQKK